MELSESMPLSMDIPEPEQTVDKDIFIIGVLAVLGVVIPIAIAPEWSNRIASEAFHYITHQLGVFYILASVMIFSFLVWLGLSRFGCIRLGGEDCKPEHSTFSWSAMMFCAGIGATLIYWGATEWAYYYQQPPFELQAGSSAAVLWSTTYGLFHWGFLGWALYCLPAVALSYSYHVKGIPFLRMSAACEPLLGRYTQRWPGRIVDALVTVGLLGSAATGLGFATELVASALSRVLQLPDTYLLKLTIVIVITCLVAASVYLGLDKGIKRLSNINGVFAIIFLVLVLVLGPTLFILKMSTASLGHFIQNFLTMATWTDPLTDSGFVESWTVFYWAWWVALGPFVGMFVCKISRGRSLRELIFGMLGYGSLGCAMYFMVLGNYGLYLELNQFLPVVDILNTQGQAAAVTSIVLSLPLGELLLILLMMIALIFAATTYDSVSYTLASGATKYLPADRHPERWHRVFWAFVVGVLPASLLYLGGLKALHAVTVVVSVPLLGVAALISVSLVRSLRNGEGDQLPDV